MKNNTREERKELIKILKTKDILWIPWSKHTLYR